MQVVLSSSGSIFCFGDKSLSLTANVVGGAAPYHFQWSGSLVDSATVFVSGGLHSVTVTDNSNYSLVKTITIAQPNPLWVDIKNVIRPTCGVFSDGTAETFVSGGSGSAQLSWHNGSTNAIQNNLASGEWAVTVTDANGCKSIDRKEVFHSSHKLDFTLEDTIAYPNSSSTNIGAELAMNEDFIVTSDPNPTNIAYPSGAVYIYKKVNGAWTADTVLDNQDTTISTFDYGKSIAIEDSMLIVSDQLAQIQGKKRGVLFVYKHTNGVWSLAQTIALDSNRVDYYLGSQIELRNGVLVAASSASLYTFKYNASSGLFEETAVLSSILNYTSATALTNIFLEDNTLAVYEGASIVNFYKICNGTPVFDHQLFIDPSFSAFQSHSLLHDGVFYSGHSNVFGIYQEIYRFTINAANHYEIDTSFSSYSNYNYTNAYHVLEDQFIVGTETSYRRVVPLNQNYSNYYTISGAGPGNTNLSRISAASNSTQFAAVTDVGIKIFDYESVFQPSISLSLDTCERKVTITTQDLAGKLHYSWSDGVDYLLNYSTSQRSALSSQSYTISVTDAEGCQLIDSIDLTSVSSPIFASNSTPDACGNIGLGTASVLATNSNANLNYTWSNGASGASISGLSSGTYTVTITDASSCQYMESVAVYDSISGVSTYNYVETYYNAAAPIATDLLACDANNIVHSGVETASTSPQLGIEWGKYNNGNYNVLASQFAYLDTITAIATSNGLSAYYGVVSGLRISIPNTSQTSWNTTLSYTLGTDTTLLALDVEGSLIAASYQDLISGVNFIDVLRVTGYNYEFVQRIECPNASYEGSFGSEIAFTDAGNLIVSATNASGTTIGKIWNYSWQSYFQFTLSSELIDPQATTGFGKLIETADDKVLVFDSENNGVSIFSPNQSQTYQLQDYFQLDTALSGVWDVAFKSSKLFALGLVGSDTALHFYQKQNNSWNLTDTILYDYTTSFVSEYSASQVELVGNKLLVAYPHAAIGRVVRFDLSDLLPDLSVDLSNQSCDLNFTFNASNATGPLDWFWSDGSSNLASQVTSYTKLADTTGAISVTVSDAFGCSDFVSAANSNLNALQIELIYDSTFTCSDQNAAFLTVNTLQGYQGSVLWNSGDTTDTIYNLEPATYSVTVSDTSGCSAVAEHSYIGNQGVIEFEVDREPGCVGSGLSLVKASLVSDQPAQFYQWNNGFTTSQISGLEGGAHYLTVTDDQGCSFTDSVVLYNYSGYQDWLYDTLLTGSQSQSGLEFGTDVKFVGNRAVISSYNGNGSSSSNNVVYLFEHNGSAWSEIDVISSPIGSSSFASSIDFVGDEIFVLSAEEKRVDVFAELTPGSLSHTDSVFLTRPGTDWCTSVKVTDDWMVMNAPGDIGAEPDAYIEVFKKVNGNWVSIQTLEFLQKTIKEIAIESGEFVATIRNSSNQSVVNHYVYSPTLDKFQLNQIIEEPFPTTIFYKAFGTDLSLSHGRLAVSYPLYSLIYYFEKENGQWVDICAQQTSACITSAPISGSLRLFGDKLYVGYRSLNANDGGIQIFQYADSSWTEIGQIALGSLSSYLDRVFISDNGIALVPGASSSNPKRLLSLNLNHEDSIEIAVIDTANLLCKDLITVETEYGFPAYQYSINNLSQLPVNNAVNDQIEVNSGSNTVEVTDALGCSASLVFYNSDTVLPMQMLIQIDSTLQCNNSANGQISALVSNGYMPYQYLWSTGDTTSTMDSISVGVYRLTVTDFSGCTVEDSIVVGSSSNIAFSAQVSKVSCANLSDGSIALTTSGNLGSLSFLWSTGATASTISGLTPGNYSVTMSDSSGCQLIQSIELETVFQDSSWVLFDTYQLDSNGVLSRFGDKVYSKDSLLVVASPGLSSSEIDQLHVYHKTASGNWIQTQVIASPYSSNYDFGRSISIEGDQIFVGAPNNAYPNSSAGKVVVYNKIGGTWYPQQFLSAPNNYNYFGRALATDSGVLVVSGEVNGPSKIYIYGISGSSWTLTQTLSTSSPSYNDDFGFAIDVDDDVLVVGAYDENNSSTSKGSLYISEYNGTSWSAFTKISPQGYYWGYDVKVQNGLIAALAVGSSYGIAISNEIGIFKKVGTTWQKIQSLVSDSAYTSASQMNSSYRSIDFVDSLLVGNTRSTGIHVFSLQNDTFHFADAAFSSAVVSMHKTASLNYPDVFVGNISIGMPYSVQRYHFKTPLQLSLSQPDLCSRDVFANTSSSVGARIFTWSTGFIDTLNSYSASMEEVDSVQQINVSVIDSLGCVATDSLSVFVPTLDAISSVFSNASGCDSAYSALVQLVDTLSPNLSYDYLWSTGDTTDTATLSFGFHNYQVTDSNGCVWSDTVYVSNDHDFQYHIDYVNGESCFNANDGQIEIITNDTSRTYLWSNGVTGKLLSGATQGNYSVTITDTLQCSEVEHVLVDNQGSKISLSPLNVITDTAAGFYYGPRQNVELTDSLLITTSKEIGSTIKVYKLIGNNWVLTNEKNRPLGSIAKMEYSDGFLLINTVNGSSGSLSIYKVESDTLSLDTTLTSNISGFGSVATLNQNEVFNYYYVPSSGNGKVSVYQRSPAGVWALKQTLTYDDSYSVQFLSVDAGLLFVSGALATSPIDVYQKVGGLWSYSQSFTTPQSFYSRYDVVDSDHQRIAVTTSTIGGVGVLIYSYENGITTLDTAIEIERPSSTIPMSIDLEGNKLAVGFGYTSQNQDDQLWLYKFIGGEWRVVNKIKATNYGPPTLFLDASLKNNRLAVQSRVVFGGGYTTQTRSFLLVDSFAEFNQESINNISCFGSSDGMVEYSFNHLQGNAFASFGGSIPSQQIQADSLLVDSVASGGTYPVSFTDITGCPLLDTFTIQEPPINSDTLVVTVCDSYYWNGSLYDNSGVYTDTYSIGACDSISVLNLSILNTDTSLIIYACDSILINSTWYFSTITIVDTLVSASSCDSVVTSNYIVLNSSVDTIQAQACDSYVWGTDTLTASGFYIDTVSNSSACFNLQVLELQIDQISIDTSYLSACGSIQLNGITFLTDTIITNTSTGANGCDSNLVYIINIDSLPTLADTVSACLQYEWRGDTLTQSGSYFDTVTNTTGCDSLYVLELTFPTQIAGLGALDTIYYCPSIDNHYNFGGTLLYESGFYSRITYSAVHSCYYTDSIHLIFLNDSVTDSVMVCDYLVLGQDTFTDEGWHTYQSTNVHGCDSIYHFYLQKNTESIELTFGNETCAGATNGMAVVTNFASLTNVMWSTGDTTAFIDSLSTGIYSLTAINAFGCTVEDSFELETNFLGENGLQRIYHTSGDTSTTANNMFVSVKDDWVFVSNRSYQTGIAGTVQVYKVVSDTLQLYQTITEIGSSPNGYGVLEVTANHLYVGSHDIVSSYSLQGGVWQFGDSVGIESYMRWAADDQRLVTWSNSNDSVYLYDVQNGNMLLDTVLFYYSSSNIVCDVENDRLLISRVGYSQTKVYDLNTWNSSTIITSQLVRAEFHQGQILMFLNSDELLIYSETPTGYMVTSGFPNFEIYGFDPFRLNVHDGLLIDKNYNSAWRAIQRDANGYWSLENYDFSELTLPAEFGFSSEYFVVASLKYGGITKDSLELYRMKVPSEVSIVSSGLCSALDSLNMWAVSTSTNPSLLFNWSNGTSDLVNGSTSYYSGLAMGQYSVTVTDAQNCVSMQTIVVDTPSVYLSSSIQILDSNLCVNQQNGILTHTTAGGMGGFSVLWNDTSSADTLINQNSGAYTLLVQDSMFCQITDSVYLSQPAQIIVYDTIVSCGSLNWLGTTLNSSGNFYQNTVSVNGCDSMVYLNFTNRNTYSNLSFTACDTFTIFGNQFVNPGSYTAVGTNAYGCDSIINFSLTLQSESITLTFRECDSLIFNGNTFYQDTTYVETFTNAVGCDSVVTYDIGVDSKPDTTVLNVGNYTLKALDSNRQYQWFRCLSNGTKQLISGATGQTFVYDVFGIDNGYFSCEITSGSCTVSSGCHFVEDLIGINEQPVISDLDLIPNPSRGKVIIVNPNLDKRIIAYTVYDAYGQIVFVESDAAKQTEQQFDVSSWASGFYLIHVSTSEGVEVLNLVVSN